MDYSKLLGKIKENGHTQKSVAEAIGISEGQFCQKFAGNYPFKQSDIQRLCDLLDIGTTDIGAYFFSPFIDKTQQSRKGGDIMATQRQLDTYIMKGVLSLFDHYEEDGEKQNLSYAETVQALQHTIDSIQTRVSMDFSTIFMIKDLKQGMKVFAIHPESLPPTGMETNPRFHKDPSLDSPAVCAAYTFVKDFGNGFVALIPCGELTEAGKLCAIKMLEERAARDGLKSIRD